MTDFALASRQDSKFFKIERDDNTVKGEVEGGYTTTRPRSTRAPRTIISTGFTTITQAEMETLQAFYDTVGKHSMFNYTNPVTSIIMVCRIEEWPHADYTGAGYNPLYNLGPIKLKEV
jgi:hypothetical protein